MEKITEEIKKIFTSLLGDKRPSFKKRIIRSKEFREFSKG
jgi:hypothetical protein